MRVIDLPLHGEESDLVRDELMHMLVWLREADWLDEGGAQGLFALHDGLAEGRKHCF